MNVILDSSVTQRGCCPNHTVTENEWEKGARKYSHNSVSARRRQQEWNNTNSTSSQGEHQLPLGASIQPSLVVLIDRKGTRLRLETRNLRRAISAGYTALSAHGTSDL